MTGLEIAAVAGAAISAVGTVSAASAAQGQANYQGQIAQNNAAIASQNADYARKAGSAAAEAQSRKGAGTEARVRAAIGANGVDVNSGSAVDVQTGQRETDTLDTETVQQNALLNAYGYKAQQTGFQAEAGLDQAKADQAPIAGALSSGAGILGDASSIGFKWQGAQTDAAKTADYVAGSSLVQGSR